MILSNVHTHSTFSDGKNTAEEMVQEAVKRGFVSLGFSDHGSAPHDGASMKPETEPKYRAEILRLKEKYKDTIELALGYEHDASMPCTDLSPYDYVIESVHFFHKADIRGMVDHSKDHMKMCVRELFGGSMEKLLRSYFSSLCEAYEHTRADIAGHIDLCAKFNEDESMFSFSDRAFLDPAREAVHCAVEKDMLIEINTGAMSRGYRSTPYPHPLLLTYAHELGARITITSDCHRAEWIDYGFAQAEALAASCGFTEKWIWRGGHFIPVALEP